MFRPQFQLPAEVGDCNMTSPRASETREVSSCILRRDPHLIVLETAAQTGIRPPKTCHDTAKQRRQATQDLKAALIAAVQGDFCNMKQLWLRKQEFPLTNGNNHVIVIRGLCTDDNT